MKVFLYEYTCAVGGSVPSLPESLRREGWAMLSALADDFGRVSGVEPLFLLEERCEGEPAAFAKLARTADYTLVIAPESDGLLLTRCRWTLAAGGRLLGPVPPAVALTGDKLALSRHLRRGGVPTPESFALDEADPFPAVSFPAVWKPRHGAGSQATFLAADEGQLRAGMRQARREGFAGEGIVQPFVAGLAVSVAFLVGPHGALALPPGRQRLSDDGRFRYLGGSLPLPPAQRHRAVELATRAIAAVPGLRGYVGVDLVQGTAADGSGDAVIEINPRLTTSYIGLRALARTNLAEVMLRVATGVPVPPLRWRDGTVEFGADGACSGSACQS
jgi:tyramine---L-glutamate ligase